MVANCVFVGTWNSNTKFTLLETIDKLHIVTIQKVYNQCMKLESWVLAEVAV